MEKQDSKHYSILNLHFEHSFYIKFLKTVMHFSQLSFIHSFIDLLFVRSSFVRSFEVVRFFIDPIMQVFRARFGPKGFYTCINT